MKMARTAKKSCILETLHYMMIFVYFIKKHSVSYNDFKILFL